MSIVLLGLAILPIAALLWLTLRRTMKVSGVAAELPGGPTLRIFDDPLCSLKGLVITELIALKDDLLVGYRGGTGSWFTVNVANPDEVLVTDGLHDVEGQFFLPMLVRDTRSMQLLHEWHSDQTHLVSVVSRDQSIVALADARFRHAVTAEHCVRP